LTELTTGSALTELTVTGAPPVISIDEAEGLSEKPVSFGRLAWRRFIRHKLAIIGAFGLVLIAAAFIVMPMLSEWSFDEIDRTAFNQGPSVAHPFGTDTIGRDLMVRTFEGGRYSLRIALFVAVLSTILGTVLGALAGFLGKAVDGIVSQLINLVLIVPALLILAVFAKKYGADPNGIAIVLALLLWTRIARVVRGLVMQLKEQEFVQAARAAGAGNLRIVFRHIMPNVMGPVLVELTLIVGIAIALESTLSFLGLGVKPPVPTLGNLLTDAKGKLDTEPIKVLIPAFAIVWITLCVNFLGDGMRDALDPKSRIEKE
jgi:ABC-type dipeptide/oligopeptide/nickel transport system permease subunit